MVTDIINALSHCTTAELEQILLEVKNQLSQPIGAFARTPPLIIPNEILDIIFKFTDNVTLIRCCTLSRHIRDTIILKQLRKRKQALFESLVPHSWEVNVDHDYYVVRIAMKQTKTPNDVKDVMLQVVPSLLLDIFLDTRSYVFEQAKSRIESIGETPTKDKLVMFLKICLVVAKDVFAIETGGWSDNLDCLFLVDDVYNTTLLTFIRSTKDV
jgi:hypothetical protein